MPPDRSPPLTVKFGEHLWRGFAVLLLALMPALARVGEPPVLQFSGYLRSTTTESTFALRWQIADGGSFRAWLRLGERADEFKLVGFDVKTETLSVEDHLGRISRLMLPEGKVRSEELTDQEFAELSKYLWQGADISSAPVLSREKARAFYLRWIQQMSPATNVEVVFDVDGHTLSPAAQAKWAEDKVRARAEGQLLSAVVINGKTELHASPMRPHPIPEPMTRNLTASDWDEIALLDQINSIKRVIVKRGNGTK